MMLAYARSVFAGVLVGASVVAVSAGAAHGEACTPDDQIAAADGYLAAIADSSLADQVAFAPGAVRFENGIQTGFSGAEMRLDLSLHLQYSVTAAPIVTSRAVGVNGDPNLLRYLFIVPVMVGGQHLLNAPTNETFVIPVASCLIERIDATIGIAPP